MRKRLKIWALACRPGACDAAKLWRGGAIVLQSRRGFSHIHRDLQDEMFVTLLYADLGPVTPPGFGEGALLYYGAAAAAAVPGVLNHLQAQLEARIVASRLVRICTQE